MLASELFECELSLLASSSPISKHSSSPYRSPCTCCYGEGQDTGEKEQKTPLAMLSIQLCQSWSRYFDYGLTIVCFIRIDLKLQGKIFPCFHLHNHILTLQVAYSFLDKRDGKWVL